MSGNIFSVNQLIKPITTEEKNKLAGMEKYVEDKIWNSALYY